MSSNQLNYITFSGGGWNSHTASSGWVNAALQGLRDKNPHIPKEKITVDTLFKNIDGLAGNSGGAWFLSMLAYSDEFEKALTNHPEKWFEEGEGYMGQLKNEFDNLWKDDQPFDEIIDNTAIILADQIMAALFSPNELNQKEHDSVWGVIALGVERVLGDMSEFSEIMQLLPLISEDSRPSWSKAVRDLCFKPFGMNDTLNHSLNQGKNKWATTKDLQITVAMPTEKVYISGKGAGKFRNDGRRVITGELVKGSATLTPNKSQTFPGFISADASDSELIFTGTDNEFETKYVNDKDNVLKSDSIPNVLANRLSVIDSVSISSSAPGLLASTDFLLKTIKNNLEINPDIFPGGDPEDKEAARQGLYHWISQVLGRYFGNLAIPVSLADSKVKMLDNASTDIVDIKSQVGTRLIDGGYVDNTAVTSALHSIQAKNNLQDKDQDQKDFSITILSNVTGGIGSIRTDDGKDIQITMDVKDLFGASNSAALKKKGGGMDFLQADIHTVSPHVFNRDALKIDNEWSYVDKDNDTYLRYYTIDVETVDNKAFGIKEGSKGVLNVFMNVTTKSDAAPFEKRIFNLYENLYKTTSNQLSKSDIHDHILGSLGIPTLIQGSRKSEKLKGTKFSERINANAGDDVIVATRGSDVLVGGRGLDLFKYDRIADSPNKKNHKDTILRFNPLEGDRIDLTEIAEIDFIGRENFSGPNQANWDGGTLMINLDEDSKAEMSISIKTPANLFEIDDIFV